MEAEKTFTVRVDNLTDAITELKLIEEFLSYGPIHDVIIKPSKGGRKFGFINFYSKEVAEVAANDKDNTFINGVKIKTSFRDESHKTRDKRVDNEGHIYPINPNGQLKTQEKPSRDADQRFVGIYWDIENCQLPSHIDPHSFVEKIRSKFLPGKKLAEFLCVCDHTRIKKSVIDGLSKAGVDVLHVSATAKNAADDKLKLRIQDFGYKHKEQAFVILISGDVNFAPVLNTLRYSLTAYTVLIHNKQASSHLKALADEKYNFDNFIADITITATASPTIKSGIVRTTELLVQNLPLEKGVEHLVKVRLSVLSDNCGGRVGAILRINGNKEAACVVSFPSADDADRALHRMRDADVCGKKILVDHYWGVDYAVTGAERKDPIFISPLDGSDTKLNSQTNLQPLLRDLKLEQQEKQMQNNGQSHKQLVVKGSTPSEAQPLSVAVKKPNPKQCQPTKMKRGASMSSIEIPKPKGIQVGILDKVQYILREFPHWLSLDRFVAKFKEIYMENFDVLQLSRLGNIFVDGKPGRVFVCLVATSISEVPIGINKADFHEMLISVLTKHKYGVLIPILPGLLWSYNKTVLKQDPSGIPLSELISTCPGLKSLHSRIFLSKRSFDVRQNVDQFIDETIDMLSFSKNWEVPIDSFAFLYEKLFGTKVYGISDFEKVISEIANGILEVIPKKGSNFLTIAVPKRKEILGKNLENLLLEKKQWIPISALSAKYYNFYGRKIPVHGDVNHLITLIRALKRESLCLFKNKDKAFSLGLKKGSFTKFKRGLTSLLSSRDGNRILYHNLEQEYQAFHGSCPQLNTLGFNHPNDLFTALKPNIAVEKIGSDLFIVLCQNAATVNPWDDVLEAIFGSSEKAVLLCSLPQKIRDRKEYLFSSVPAFVSVLGFGESACFILNSKYEELVADDIVTHARKLLYGSPDFKQSIQGILDRFGGSHKQKSSFFKTLFSNGTFSVQGDVVILNQNTALRYFAYEVLSLLFEQPEHSCTVNQFCGLYHKKFGRQYKVANFGLKKAIDLFKAIGNDRIEIATTSGSSPMLRLAPNGQFIEEAKKLLIDNNGMVFLNDLKKIYKRIVNGSPLLYDNMSSIFESCPELFASFDLKSTSKTHDLVLLKHFQTSFETGMKQSNEQVNTNAKSSATVENAENQRRQRVSSGGQSSNDDKSSLNDRSLVAEHQGARKKKKSKCKKKKTKPVPTVDKKHDDSAMSKDLSGIQFSSNSDSSDDESVIIEKEECLSLGEFSDNAMSSQSANEIDLLSFDETESESDLNWWIHDVPDHLPSPSIKPEPIKSENDNTVGDLISLADDGIESGGGSGEERNEWARLSNHEPEIPMDLLDLI